MLTTQNNNKFKDSNYDDKYITKIGFQHVGSFLRPVELKQARERFAAGSLTQQELTAVEDIAIIDLVKKQAAAGLDVVTDGEFRRSYWHFG